MNKCKTPWEVFMQLNASALLLTLRRLGSLNEKYVTLTDAGLNKSARFCVSQDDYAEIISDVEALETACEEMGLSLAKRTSGEFKKFLSENLGSSGPSFGMLEMQRYSEYYNNCESRIRDELDESVAHLVRKSDVAAYHSAASIFGEEPVQKFPSLAHDFEECAKCLSLGRGTASVFHAVRCLEAMLRATAKSLGIADPVRGAERNWSKVLQKIKAEIDARWPPASRLNGDGPVFDRIHASLSSMQNPYRNSTMHIEASFTEQEARDTVHLIAGVARQIASRLDEDGLPYA